MNAGKLKEINHDYVLIEELTANCHFQQATAMDETRKIDCKLSWRVKTGKRR